MQKLGMEETIVDEFIGNLASILDTFRSWVTEIDLPQGSRRSFRFETSSVFVNFNYTETLETFYGTEASRIFYIHGRRGTNDRLVVGHDSDPPRALGKARDQPALQWSTGNSVL